MRKTLLRRSRVLTQHLTTLCSWNQALMYGPYIGIYQFIHPTVESSNHAICVFKSINPMKILFRLCLAHLFAPFRQLIIGSATRTIISNKKTHTYTIYVWHVFPAITNAIIHCRERECAKHLHHVIIQSRNFYYLQWWWVHMMPYTRYVISMTEHSLRTAKNSERQI